MRDLIRTKWAAVGAAVAVTLGAGGVSLTQAAISSGEKPVYIALDAPCRLVDTRPATTIGPKNTPIAAGDANVYEIQVTGANGNCTGPLAIPAEAAAVATNVTAIAPVAPTTGRSFFTVYPGDATRPTTSNLNFLNGAPPVPNKVDVGLSATGTIKIYNNEGEAHAAVDVFGYYIDHNHDDLYYTEGEVDTALGAKANAADVYTKAETDAAVATKDNVEADVDSSTSPVALSATDAVVASVTVQTPTSGYVVVNSGGYVWNGDTIVRCSITPGTTVDLSASVNINVNATANRSAAGTTRGFTINKLFLPGSNSATYNLVCDTSGGTASYEDPQLTAIFVPDPDAFGLIVIGSGTDDGAPDASDG
jgi:hypothetical protein